MSITLDAALEAALAAAAVKRGVSAEELAQSTLRTRFLLPEPVDQWHRILRMAATDCGVSLPDEAFSSEALYD